MSSDPIRYVGFAVVTSGREYQFRVAGSRSEDAERIFTFWIGTAGFRPGRLKFQEGPDISLRKLRNLLAGEQEGLPLLLHQELSESDITDYTAKAPAKHKAWTDEQRAAARQRQQNRQG